MTRVDVAMRLDDPFQRLAPIDHRHERAHEISPSARTLRGIGMASFEMHSRVDVEAVLGTNVTAVVLLGSKRRSDP